MEDCIFCRIVRGEIPANVVYRDEQVTAFRDIQPRAPTHILLVTNEHVASVEHLEDRHQAAAGALLLAARQIARQEGVVERGYRLVVNTGPDANQTVQHLHLHLLAGRTFGWPPG